jgi:hypothetical protein
VGLLAEHHLVLHRVAGAGDGQAGERAGELGDVGLA